MRLVDALARRPLDRPPVWFMRQAGRYLPEYRDLRSRYTFEEAMRTPSVAAEITMQPLRRFALDAAIVFSDIMTPLSAMGVPIDFKPGPQLEPMDIKEVASLSDLDPAAVGYVAETVAAVREATPPEIAVIGFAGGPATLLAYLTEGGGSKQFPEFRSVLHHDVVEDALEVLGHAMNRYLTSQVEAGADVVQLFDSWAGLLSVEQWERLAAPAARTALAGLDVPTIYFTPAAGHLLERFHVVGATAYGVDWRLGLREARRLIGADHPIQGNLDPAVLLTAPDRVRAETNRVLESGAGAPGHIYNLGHGIFPDTPVENVTAMVETVIGWPNRKETS